jgi:erythromycin esterase-like protein
MQSANAIVGALRDAAQPLRGSNADYDALLELIGDARLVLLGEATHGTHEFYCARAQITKRLIAEKGFTAVAEPEAKARLAYSPWHRCCAYFRRPFGSIEQDLL